MPAKRTQPDFQIDGDASNADFGGLLKIGDVTITSDERWHSKKEAREALAEKGFQTVEKMENKKKGTSAPGDKDKNWIGMLVGTCSVFLEASTKALSSSDYLYQNTTNSSIQSKDRSTMTTPSMDPHSALPVPFPVVQTNRLVPRPHHFPQRRQHVRMLQDLLLSI